MHLREWSASIIVNGRARIAPCSCHRSPILRRDQGGLVLLGTGPIGEDVPLAPRATGLTDSSLYRILYFIKERR